MNNTETRKQMIVDDIHDARLKYENAEYSGDKVAIIKAAKELENLKRKLRELL